MLVRVRLATDDGLEDDTAVLLCHLLAIYYEMEWMKMLRFINLKNYRSFTDLSFDMTGKSGKPKSMIILYGENGAGKTNLVNVLDTLYATFNTLSLREYVMSLLEQRQDPMEQDKKTLIYSLFDISHIIRENKTIGSNDNMSIEIGFCINGKNGIYYIEFDNEQIVGERLEYVYKKNKITFFDIRSGNAKINPQVFSGEYLAELGIKKEKYWGKHSIMAILFNALNEYSEDYIGRSFGRALMEALDYFHDFTVYLVKNKSRKEIIRTPDSMLEDFDEGEIDESGEEIIHQTERILSIYFHQIYKDINRVFYRIEKSESKLKYCLYFERMISGKPVEVRYNEESCGTRNLLSLLPYFIASINGRVVAIDEIDNGIHDMLLKNLIVNLFKNIDGQLILTTHNTMFIDEYDYKDSIYFLIVSKEGSKEIKSINDFGYRIQPNSNVMANYLKGKFVELPWNGMNVDFESLNNLEHSYSAH